MFLFLTIACLEFLKTSYQCWEIENKGKYFPNDVHYINLAKESNYSLSVEGC